MAGARWRPAEVDLAAVNALASEARLRPLTARILVGRGLGAIDLAHPFLNPRLSDMRPPDGIGDLDRALGRLASAVIAREVIGVFGDYDVDGVTTAAVLVSSLRAFGANVRVRVASRSSGYGLSPQDASILAHEGCQLVVTGDCGTSDHDALSLLRSQGIDTIVIDHHQVPSGESPAYALINPHRRDDAFPFKGLCSCGLAFYMMAALRTRLRGAGHPGAEAFDPRSQLDLVALGTIADVVPLQAENRILVTAGLRTLARMERPGLRALARMAELDPRDGITETQVSFRLTPRLNAAGRLGDAKLALDVLLAADDAEATRLVAELDDRNSERQKIQKDVVEQAMAEAEAQLAVDPDLPALVVGAEGWHHGVVGIVAAKLVDKYRRPAVVVGFQGEEGRGSGRTVGGVDLHRALQLCAQHLDKFGGHAAAAGLSVRPQHMEAFRQTFLGAVAQQQNGVGSHLDAALLVDAVVGLRDLDLAGSEELERLAPFGCANEQPLLALAGVTASASRVVGKTHLQLTLADGGAVADAIAFGQAENKPTDGQTLDILGFAEIDRFRGSRRPRLRVKHLLPLAD